MSKMITIADAAEELGCTRENIYQLIKRHKLKTEVRMVEREETVIRKIKQKHVDLDELMKLYQE